jgi:hypothetical protein
LLPSLPFTFISREVAFTNFAASECPLLFEIQSPDFNTHGANVAYLSVHPKEQEILYPPLTYMRCLGTSKQEIKSGSGGQSQTVLVAKVELVLS